MNEICDSRPMLVQCFRDLLTTPIFILLVGLPGSGKSWFRGEYGRYCTQLSSDDIIEANARTLGKSYSEVFQQFADDAQVAVWDAFGQAVRRRDWVMWDQTNLGQKKRKSILQRVPTDYVKVAVYFEIDEALRQQRLSARSDKVIPPVIDMRMRGSYVRPTLQEGWNAVIDAESLL